MSSFSDQKYIGQIGFTLRNFSRKSNKLYSFSCPYCGDSKINKYKARGFFYINQSNDWQYKCHNCGIGKSFTNFLRDQAPLLYKEYRFENFANKKSNDVDILSIESLFDDLGTQNELDNLVLRCDKLQDGHPAIEYLKSRSILLKHERFYYSINLTILKQIFSGYDNVVFKDEPRIIFPIKNISKKLVGVVTRSIKENAKLRYINLRKGNDPLIYNIENINFSQRKYVVEGPIDSLFLKNCVAAIGSDLLKCKDILDSNTTYIFDNQPKNMEIIKKMEYLVSVGCSIVVWPYSPEIKEDINDMIDQNIDVDNIINNNTYTGLSSKLKIKAWRKI